MHEIKIDKNKCVGCELCATLCGELFEMNGDKAIVKNLKSSSPCAKEAAENCPEQAISITEG
ncbi:MAG: ferredoxin [archaeon]